MAIRLSSPARWRCPVEALLDAHHQLVPDRPVFVQDLLPAACCQFREADAGTVDNTATATSNETGPVSATYQVPVTESAAIDITKEAASIRATDGLLDSSRVPIPEVTS